uniref:Uncharacterized protein n=1 Tax=Sphaerodactylus townsendi TaxID=933632 RepID=A0ACB8ET45_9SAUR
MDSAPPQGLSAPSSPSWTEPQRSRQPFGGSKGQRQILPQSRNAPQRGSSCAGLASAALRLPPLDWPLVRLCPENCAAQGRTCQALLGIKKPLEQKGIGQEDRFPELLVNSPDSARGGEERVSEKMCEGKEEDAERLLSSPDNVQPRVTEEGGSRGGWAAARPNQGLPSCPSAPLGGYSWSSSHAPPDLPQLLLHEGMGKVLEREEGDCPRPTVRGSDGFISDRMSMYSLAINKENKG